MIISKQNHGITFTQREQIKIKVTIYAHSVARIAYHIAHYICASQGTFRNRRAKNQLWLESFSIIIKYVCSWTKQTLFGTYNDSILVFIKLALRKTTST